jgi:hypothetical protein
MLLCIEIGRKGFNGMKRHMNNSKEKGTNEMSKGALL